MQTTNAQTSLRIHAVYSAHLLFSGRYAVACKQQMHRPACAYMQSDLRICYSLEGMIVLLGP